MDVGHCGYAGPRTSALFIDLSLEQLVGYTVCDLVSRAYIRQCTMPGTAVEYCTVQGAALSAAQSGMQY